MQSRTTRPEILVIDDDPSNLKLLNQILKNDYRVYLATNGILALDFLETHMPDIILLDVLMPQMDGYEVIRRIKANPRLKEIPVIFLTGLDGVSNETKSFELGAADFLTKPIVAESVRNRVGLQLELERYRKYLEDEVEARTEKLKRTQDVILNILANMTEIRDNDTGAHIKRTTEYVRALVVALQALNLPDYEISEEYGRDIIRAAKLHDIGKISVPDAVLLKPGRLTPEEFEQVKLHTVFGASVVDEALHDFAENVPFLEVARDIVLSHHEKWNGTGYPNALAGADIPLAGRIVAIADVYDALISERTYKKQSTHEEAMAIILDGAGSHFDPVLVAELRETIDSFKNIVRMYGSV